MKNSLMEKLIEEYHSTIKNNLYNIKKQASVNVDPRAIEGALERSTENITDKWRNNRKTLRTMIAYEGLDGYPSSILKLSLMLDALINLLDDIYDEELSKEEMSLYIIELIRMLANLNNKIFPHGLRPKLEGYFNKILIIAFSEIEYKNRITQSEDFNRRLNHVIGCYKIKSTDMDVFIELPLEALGLKKEVVDQFVSLGRIHRAASIIVKDLKDLEHDIKIDVETPVVILYREDIGELYNYLDKCVNYFEEEAQKIWENIPSNRRNIGENIYNMISQVLDEYESKKPLIPDF